MRVCEASRPLSDRDGRARVRVRTIYCRYVRDQNGGTELHFTASKGRRGHYLLYELVDFEFVRVLAFWGGRWRYRKINLLSGGSLDIVQEVGEI